MSDALVILGLVAFGPGLLAYVSYLIRRKRWRDSMPLLEVLIDKAVGVQPPTRNRIDHAFLILQLGLMSLVGLIVTGLGLFVIPKDSGILE